MKVALFLTADRDAARAILAAELRRHPEGARPELIAFAHDEDREALQREFPSVSFRSDKPSGGRGAFVRSLRAERFDRAVVAWTGGERFLPLRLVALAAAADVLAVDERCREFRVAAFAPWTWGGHAARRLAGVKLATLAGALAAAYRATVGLLLGCALLGARSLLRRARP